MQIKYGYRQIDQEQWKRRDHFQVFGRGEYPYIGLTTPVDVTSLVAACRERKIRFFNAFLYATTRAANAVDNFRYRIYEDQIVLLDAADPSFNVMDKEHELFYFAYAAYDRKFRRFNDNAEQAKKAALDAHCLSGNRVDVFYMSCLPWFGFSDIVQPLGLSANDSIPRFAWGKFEDDGKKISMPFSVTGHHGLFDGLHISKLLDIMKLLLDDPEKFLDETAD